MSPFRDKPVKWEGEEDTDRYKNVNGFKYDVVEKGTVYIRSEDFLSDFLGATPIEAKETYEKFKATLNNLAFSYAVSTGLPKGDLFGEAVIGLARAKRDFDKKRSKDFRTYAIIRIKDSLNEYIRENSATVSVPAYLKNANRHIHSLKELMHQRGFCDEDIDNILKDKELEVGIPKDIRAMCSYLIKNLRNTAIRAKVPVDKLVARAAFVPVDAPLQEIDTSDIQNREEEKIHAALIVNKLKKFMTERELKIAEGIMAGRTYEEIADMFGKTAPWVTQNMEKMRKKLAKKVDIENFKL